MLFSSQGTSHGPRQGEEGGFALLLLCLWRFLFVVGQDIIPYTILNRNYILAGKRLRGQLLQKQTEHVLGRVLNGQSVLNNFLLCSPQHMSVAYPIQG
jgi:hypothetical protein